jgi:DNA-directed RNA polymerase subunit RPC12/RpoP
MTTDDERDLAQALFRTLYDAGVSFQSGDLIPRLTATVRAAGFRRQGPITDARPWRPEDGDTRCQACGKRNPVWWANNDDWNALMPDDGILCPSCYHSRWLEAAERARSAVPSTTEQERR